MVTTIAAAAVCGRRLEVGYSAHVQDGHATWHGLAARETALIERR
jgi:hypothetical protein